MAKKQSGSAASTIAGKYVKMTNAEFYELADDACHFHPTRGKRFFRDIRKLAASVLAQDETKGQKRLSGPAKAEAMKRSALIHMKMADSIRSQAAKASL